MSSEYKLTDAFFRNFNLKILRTTIPLMLSALVAAWYIAGAHTDLWGLVPFVVVVAIMLPFTLRRTLRQQHKTYRSLRIRLESDRIVREQDGLARLEIAFKDITALQEAAGGQGILIRGTGAQQFISALATLERYDELRARLAQIRPFEPLPTPPAKTALLRFFAAAAVPLICMVVFYRSESFATVMVSGSLLLAAVITSVVLIVRSPHVEQRIKRWLWAIIPLILSVAAKMWFMLSPR